MDWKDDIGAFLTSKRIYRFEFLEKQLIEICKEWKIFMEKFDGIKVGIDKKFEYGQNPIIKLSSVINDNKEQLNPFVVEIRYVESESHTIALSIKYSTASDFGKSLENIVSYSYEEILYNDEGIFEPAYIQQTLNNIFKIQFSTIKLH
ncbi:MAG: hypothetical protein ACOYOV_03045 [Bacteroidales bacterium]